MIDIDNLKSNINTVLENEYMHKHTSFKTGGIADVMVMPKDAEEIIYTIKYCYSNQIPLTMIGNGSNILVRDGGIRGIVLKTSDTFNKFEIDNLQIKAQSGVMLAKIAIAAVKNNLEGLEFAAGIPGTLGGAVAMNAGAYGGCMDQVLKEASAVDREGNVYLLSNKDLEFAYRESLIQRKHLFVLDVLLELKKGDSQKSQALISEMAKKRSNTQPLKYPSAGSAFKRPEGYYAGKLIEDAGLKGFSIGGAMVSKKHAGFVINNGNATSADIESLLFAVQQKVYDKFKVKMEMEIKIIGQK